MSYISRLRVAANVTASGGAAQSFYTSALANGGYVESIAISKPASSGISSAANVLITCDNSSQVILTGTSTGSTAGGTVTYTPRNIVTKTDFSPLGPATGAGMSLGIPALIPVGAGERIKVTFSSAGTASAGGKSATLDFYISGN